MPDDTDSDDPFFGDPPEREKINAWEIDEHAGWLREQGYSPGDEMTITWRGSDGEIRETQIELPENDWDNPRSWHDFYDEMREFYEDIWGGDDGYAGEATAG